jgi:hypothetical protein
MARHHTHGCGGAKRFGKVFAGDWKKERSTTEDTEKEEWNTDERR